MLPHISTYKDDWVVLRKRMMLRSIVLYWEELTAYQMAPGGAAYERDVSEFGAFSYAE